MTIEPKSLAELLKQRSQLDAELEQFQRLVTVMFTDIAGSTRYFDEHGDLAGMAMVQDCNNCLQPQVGKHEGKIVKTIGDAIMVYFENPVQAVRCAIIMQRSIAELNKQRSEKQQIRIRVALNLGVGLLKDNDVFGDVVNVCSRIEHETEAGRIGVSPSVVEAVSKEKEIACRKIGTVSLRGKLGEMDLYEVLWREGEKVTDLPEAKISRQQLALSTGVKLELDEEVRRAISASIKGEAPPGKVPAAEKRNFVLVEVLPDRSLGRRFPLKGATAIVGRERGEILFPDAPALSPEHALFSVLGNALYVEDLDSADGTFIQLSQPRSLCDDDIILLARQAFRVRLEAGEPTPRVELVRLVEGGLEEKRFPIERGETTFGRTRGTYTFPDDSYISGLHARITLHGPHCLLTDLNSSNGTFLRIREKELLDLEDTVLVGGQRLRVFAEPAGAEEPGAGPGPASSSTPKGGGPAPSKAKE